MSSSIFCWEHTNLKMRVTSVDQMEPAIGGPVEIRRAVEEIVSATAMAAVEAEASATDLAVAIASVTVGAHDGAAAEIGGETEVVVGQTNALLTLSASLVAKTKTNQTLAETPSALSDLRTCELMT